MPRPIGGALQGALWAILAITVAGALYGVLVPLKECSVTADVFTSMMFAMTVFIASLGGPATLIGAIFGAALEYWGNGGSRSEASHKTRDDDLA